MSEAILDWLNGTVRLSRQVVTFERDFSNGFLFGELLHKHGLLGEFTEAFVDDSDFKAAWANFAHLKYAFRGPAANLGIQLKDEHIAEIIAGDRGTSLRLLFQIRKGLKGITTASAQGSEGPHGEGLKREGRASLSNHFFQTRIQPSGHNNKRLAQEVHAKPFVDRYASHMQHRANMQARDVEDARNCSSSLATASCKNMQESKRGKKLAERKHNDRWARNIETRIDSMQKDLNQEKQFVKQKHQRVENIRQRHRSECGYLKGCDTDGIGWFEMNLQHLGIDASEHAGTLESNLHASTAKEFYQELEKKLPADAHMQVETKKSMQKIKKTKQGNDAGQREREQRQRRAQVEQENTQARMDEQKCEDELLSRLLTDAQKYRCEAMAYAQRQRFKVAAHAERVARQEMQKGTSASLKEHMAITRHKQCQVECNDGSRQVVACAPKNLASGDSSSDDNEMQDQEDDEEHLWGEQDVEAEENVEEEEEEGEAHAATKEDERGEEQGDGKRSVSNASVSTKRLSHGRKPRASGAGTASKDQLRPPEELLNSASQATSTNYFFARGEWALYQPNQETLQALLEHATSTPQELDSTWTKPHARFGDLVAWLCAPPPASAQKTNLPPGFPIISVGSSAAGQNLDELPAVVAKHLCEELEMALVQPQAVVNECLALAGGQEQDSDWPIVARLQQLGRSVLSQGNIGSVAIPNAVLAEMIFRKIELLVAPAPPKPGDEEEPKSPKGDAKKKKPTAKGKDKKEEDKDKEPPKRLRGAVVLDFPADLSAHIAWEAAVCGFSSPLFHVHDSANDLHLQLSSILAPGNLVQTLQQSKDYRDAMSSRTLMIKISLPKPGPFGDAIVRRVATEAKPTDPLCASSSAACVTTLGGVDSSVDGAWLGEVEHVLIREFQRPLGGVHELIATDPVHEGDAAEAGSETREDSYCRRAKQAVHNWRQREQPGALSGETELIVDDTTPQIVEHNMSIQTAGGSNRSTLRDVSAVALEEEAIQPPWHGLDLQVRTRMRNVWLKHISMYFTELQAIFDETSCLADIYSNEVNALQRRFLDFLQASDDRGLVLTETVKSWLTRGTEDRPDVQSDTDQIDDLSDRLWRFADERRAYAVRERLRLMDGSLWKEQTVAIMRLAARLQGVEHCRFQTSIELLSEAFASPPPVRNQPKHPGSPDGSLSLQEIDDWLHGHTKHLAGGAVDVDEASMQLGLANELRATFAQEQQSFVTRLCAIEEWARARLRVVHEQLDEVFQRMDGWIRDRVRAENNAINAAMQQVRAEDWSEVGALGASEVVRPHCTGRRPSLSLKTRRSIVESVTQERCAHILVVLEADLLKVDIYKPPSLSQTTAAQIPADGYAARDCWTLAMLRDIMHGIVERCGRTGTVDQEVLLQELLTRRNESLSLRKLSVPLGWVRRSDDAFHALCRGFVVEEWGNVQVDVTEFLLALTFHSCRLPWPSLGALRSARCLLRDTLQTTHDFLEVRLCESEFMSLPLWDENELAKARRQNEAPTCEVVAVQQWLFQVLLCFQGELHPHCLNTNTKLSRQSVSVHRMFSYLGLGVMPTDGLQRAMELLMPDPPSTPYSPDEPTLDGTLRVQDLWGLLFSHCGRPATAVAGAPSLAEFCRDLLAPSVVESKQEVTTEKEAPPKSKNKKQVAPEPAKSKSPTGSILEVPPEEAVVRLTEEELLCHPAVVRALASHGSLRCRRQVLDRLFPNEDSELPLLTSLKAAASLGLESLVPPAGMVSESKADFPG